MICGFVAANWTPSWPWWAYWASYIPSPLGYSVFLCVNLSEYRRTRWLTWLISLLVALVSSVDSKQMVSIARDYTYRSFC